MIEQATDKVSATTFLEIIVILLVILVALIMISNFLIKKNEYKEYDEGHNISQQNLTDLINWLKSK